MSALEWIYVAGASLAVLMSIIRMIKGPSVADRVVALDVFTTITVTMFVFFAFVFDRFIYIDVGLVYCVLSFVGVLVVARFIERGF